MIERIETLIIGGGPAGLARSYCLGQHGCEHVVLERGRVAERWRNERWDSLKRDPETRAKVREWLGRRGVSIRVL